MNDEAIPGEIMENYTLIIGSKILFYTEKDINSAKDIHKEIMDAFKVEYLKDLNKTDDVTCVLQCVEKWGKELERCQKFSTMITTKRNK
jgi:hypothetical protein